LPRLPEGAGWLFLELAGADGPELRDRAAALVASSGCRDGWSVEVPASAGALWRLRSEGAGLAAVALDRPAHAGWEDAAVPVEALGAYLREFEGLLSLHGLHALPYGHFGEGCVHARIDFPLDKPDGAARLKAFVEDAADLVGRFGGSLSGEHGDGRARSALLPRMYSPEALAIFSEIKRVFDPHNLFNPGVLVDPAPVDASLRLTAPRSLLAQRHPAFAEAAHRCTGVGKCLATSNGVMCPSYRATGEEKDSTRGRARVLQEMLDGRLVAPDWAAPEVHQALELCLACKACATECPTGVDVAHLKSVVLNEAYRGKLRPRVHYALGWLPAWGRHVSGVPGLAAALNTVLTWPWPRRIGSWAAGIGAGQSLPRFARRRTPPLPRGGRPVAVWVDSWSAIFEGAQLPALVALLADAGYAPTIVERTACCGLPWTSTGQREHGARAVKGTLDVLSPIAQAGVPIVGLEPSCVAALRGDAAGLVDDPRVGGVIAALHTPAELLLSDPAWRPPDLSGLTVVVQPHCHHRAVLGWAADAALLASTGASVITVAGCCGLAGTFG
ncbi:MAG: FAD-linked oxidase C-terminal domain-containing protein, partial [Micropruina sp.]